MTGWVLRLLFTPLRCAIRITAPHLTPIPNPYPKTVAAQSENSMSEGRMRATPASVASTRNPGASPTDKGVD